MRELCNPMKVLAYPEPKHTCHPLSRSRESWQAPISYVDILKQHLCASNSSLENAGKALLVSLNDIVYTFKLWSNRQVLYKVRVPYGVACMYTFRKETRASF